MYHFSLSLSLSPSLFLQYSSVDVCDLNDLLLMKEYCPAFTLDGNDFGIEDDDEEVEEDDNSLSLYPSLMELSMGRSPSPDSSREDLTTMSLTCNEEGEFGFVLRHFTVIANVPVSEFITTYCMCTYQFAFSIV